jgi:hypothetical protein
MQGFFMRDIFSSIPQIIFESKCVANENQNILTDNNKLK